MLWFLAIAILCLCAVLVLPAGIEIESAGTVKRRRLILAGLRFPLPWRWARKSRVKRLRISAGWDMEFVTRLASELDEDDLRAAWKSARGLFGCARVRVHRLALHVASPDPALTGFAYGMAWAGLGAMGIPQQVSVDADFTQTRPRAEFRIELSARPARVLYEMMRALWRMVLRRPLRMKRLWGVIRRRADHVRNGGR
jgi:hypothetical protein